MINPIFILTEHDVYWDSNADKYEDILQKYQVDGHLYKYKPNYVKIKWVKKEFEWTRIIDQDYIPDWYNPELANEACSLAMKRWIDYNTIKSDSHTFSGIVNKIISSGNVIINDLEEESELWVYGLDDNNTKVEINNMKGGRVNFLGFYTCTFILNNQSGGFCSL